MAGGYDGDSLRRLLVAMNLDGGTTTEPLTYNLVADLRAIGDALAPNGKRSADMSVGIGNSMATGIGAFGLPPSVGLGIGAIGVPISTVPHIFGNPSLVDLGKDADQRQTLAGLGALFQPSTSEGFGIGAFNGAAPARKRKVFFSFHYADVFRVNNVRNVERFKAKVLDVKQRFLDQSLWEKRKLTDPDGLKRMIREGVRNSSVICVLIGSGTWDRPWVRYEIARALIDKRGLLGVHLNGLKHHQDGVPQSLGNNPFDYIGIANTRAGFRIVEKVDGKWRWYADYARTIDVPRYLPKPDLNKVVRVSACVNCYDYAAQDGSHRMPRWLDDAARDAGR